MFQLVAMIGVIIVNLGAAAALTVALVRARGRR